MDNIFEQGTFTDENLPDFVQEAPGETLEETTEVAPPERPRDEHGRFTKVEEEQPEEIVEETEEPEEPTLEQPVLDEAPEEGEVEAPTEEQVKAWAGKYSSPEELEKGYREIRDLQRRTAEQRNAYEQALQESQYRAAQMEEALRRAVPIVQQAMAQQQQPQTDEWGQPLPQQQQPNLTPQQVQQQIDWQVQQRLQQQAALQQEQWAQQQEYNEGRAAMEEFFSRHTEVEPGGSVDEDIAATVLALNEAWADTDLDIASVDSLEIAYEAAQRPALRQVLELNPQYVDTDEGMVLARRLASELDGITQTKTSPRGTSAPRSNTPVVERGSSTAPQEGPPMDEFEEGAAEYRAEKKRLSESVFFGG